MIKSEPIYKIQSTGKRDGRGLVIAHHAPIFFLLIFLAVIVLLAEITIVVALHHVSSMAPIANLPSDVLVCILLFADFHTILASLDVSHTFRKAAIAACCSNCTLVRQLKGVLPLQLVQAVEMWRATGNMQVPGGCKWTECSIIMEGAGNWYWTAAGETEKRVIFQRQAVMFVHPRHNNEPQGLYAVHLGCNPEGDIYAFCSFSGSSTDPKFGMCVVEETLLRRLGIHDTWPNHFT